MSNDAVDLEGYAAASPELLDLILGESDKRVGAQVQLMLAADQRANGILAACVTLGAGGIGFAIAQLRDHHADALFWAALLFGVVEVVAAIFALAALWPEPVNPPGWSPSKFEDDLKQTVTQTKAQMVAFMDRRIRFNRKCASKLSIRIRWSMLLALEGPIFGLTAGLGCAGIAASHLAALVGLVVAVTFGGKLLPGQLSED